MFKSGMSLVDVGRTLSNCWERSKYTLIKGYWVINTFSKYHACTKCVLDNRKLTESCYPKTNE